MKIRPPVYSAIDRNGATIGTAATSTGAANAVTEAIGSSACAAAVSSTKSPPRLHPTRCTGQGSASAVASSWHTRATTAGTTSSTQVSSPRWRPGQSAVS